MKIGYISDLHLEFREKLLRPVKPGHKHFYGDFSLPEKLDCDVLVIAGDTHPDKAVRDAVLKDMESHYGIPILHPNGNHDYYGSSFPTEFGDIVTINGVRFAIATLWTYLGPLEEMMASRFSDFRFIKDISPAKWVQLHIEQVGFLRDSKADVILTHHAPTYGSVHERWRGDHFNPFFVNNLDMSQFSNCKLWIHGHVHDEFDYLVDEIRICCNPLGYPLEHTRQVDAKIVELEV